jgi:hypothetical protein
MRKLLFLPLFLLIAACGSATSPVDTAVPESSGGDEAAVPQESEQEAPQSGESTQDGKGSVATGTTPQEASIVREQDYVKGTDDPKVTIVEYGDFQ